jgi:uncharacterized protein
MVVTEPFDLLDVARVAVFADPAIVVFCVWQPRERKGAQLVNEPGAWSFSVLNTRDPEDARSFYGAVFGWDSERRARAKTRSHCDACRATKVVSPSNRYPATWSARWLR